MKIRLYRDKIKYSLAYSVLLKDGTWAEAGLIDEIYLRDCEFIVDKELKAKGEFYHAWVEGELWINPDLANSIFLTEQVLYKPTKMKEFHNEFGTVVSKANFLYGKGKYIYAH